MSFKKVTSILVGVFSAFLVMFVILSHLLSYAVVGEGKFFAQVGEAIWAGMLFIGTPVFTIQYFGVLFVLLATLVILVTWITKLAKGKANWDKIFKPAIFLLSILLTLTLLKHRAQLEALYAQQDTRLIVGYLVFIAVILLVLGLHIMVLGLAAPVKDPKKCDHHHLSEEDVRRIVAEALGKPAEVEEAPVEEKTEEVVEEKSVEEKKEEKVEKAEAKPVEPVVAAKVETPAEPKNAEPLPKQEVKVVEGIDEEAAEIDFERIPFAERIAHFDKELLEKYDELKNYMLAYGIKSRLSSSGDSFRAKRVMYFKITNSGNSGFKVYFKLDLDAYANTTYPLKDAQGIKMYEEVPAFMYLKSDLSLKRCKELVDDVMAAHGFKKK